jgi:hypothetical protein
MDIVKHEPNQFKNFFTEALDHYLEASQIPSKNTGIIRPSQIHYCSRWLAADILGKIPFEPKTAIQERILNNGSYVHKRYLNKYVPKMGIVSHILDIRKGEVKPFIEVSLRDDSLWLKGSPDAIIVNPNDGLAYVFELKSIRDGEFKTLEFAKPEHVLQLHCYFYLANIGQGILFYESKDSQQTKEFIIKRDELIMNNILNKIYKIQKAVQEKILPECEFQMKKTCHCRGLLV